MALERSQSIDATLHTILDDEPLPPTKPLSLCAKLRLVFTGISVEPLMVLFVLPSVMSSLAIQNLHLEKACRVNLGNDPSLCDALQARNISGYTPADEEAVQKLVATAMAWKNVFQSLIPCCLLLFLGSWSDRHQRRKPCILAPIVGEMVSCCGFLLCTYFFYQWPVQVTVFFEAVPAALGGGWFGMFMGVFSYVSNASSVETRTLRIGAVNMFSNISITIGISLSGILLSKIGFYGVFSTALTMYGISLVYGSLGVKELNPKSKAEVLKNNVNPIKDFFDIKNVKETFKVAFKQRGSNRKARILTIMCLVMVIIGPMHGEMNVMYLFLRRRFGWNAIDYSVFSTFHFIAHTLGTIFSLVFFTKFLKLDDALLGIISSTSKIVACLIYTFAPTSQIFYAGAIAEMLNGTSFIAMRSIMSKLVPPDELGKINSLFGVAEAFVPLIYGPMYSFVYKKTITFLPGAFFLLGGILTTPAIFIFFWLYYVHKKDRKAEELEKLKNARTNDTNKTTEYDGLITRKD